MCKISVITITYNRAHYIEDAIQSVLGQTKKPFEYIVIDDGSTDITKEILKKYQLRYIYKEHTGIPDSRNTGIRESAGDYILWLDSDDILIENTLELYLEKIRKDTEIDVLYGNLNVIDNNKKFIGKTEYTDYATNSSLLNDLFKRDPIPNPGTLIKKNIYEKFGVYNTDLAISDDYEFWTRIALKAKFQNIGCPVINYRWHNENISKLSESLLKENSYVLKKLLNEYSLKQIFPFSNLLEANLSIAEKFIEYHDYQNALYYLKTCLECQPTLKEKNIIEHLIRWVISK